MNEDSIKPTVIKILRELDAVSVENAARSGTPDINFVEGWIELKWKSSWPVRPQTPLRVETFTPQQRAWITRRWRAGGNIWVLLRVGHEWLLFPGLWAALHLGEKTQSELKGNAKFWSNALEPRTLVDILRIGRGTGSPNYSPPENGSGLTGCAAPKTSTLPLSD